MLVMKNYISGYFCRKVAIKKTGNILILWSNVHAPKLCLKKSSKHRVTYTAVHSSFTWNNSKLKRTKCTLISRVVIMLCCILNTT